MSNAMARSTHRAIAFETKKGLMIETGSKQLKGELLLGQIRNTSGILAAGGEGAK
jgi:hypothetical protein